MRKKDTGLPVLAQNPDNKIHGANVGPIWGRQDPGGPHVGPMNFAIWEVVKIIVIQVQLCTIKACSWLYVYSIYTIYIIYNINDV